jgi:hypothetical protein
MNSGRVEYGPPATVVGLGFNNVEIGRTDHDPRKADPPRHLLSYEHAPMVQKEPVR